MKTKNALLMIAMFFGLTQLNAQDVTTVEAMNSEISENLDLEAVASIFGEAEDLEDFEKRLNDPETQISNLDLNEDGEVDYLRVIESSEGETHLVTIQAVIGKDQYQDVAVIDVEKDSEGETKVQVVGDVNMYGPTYIIEPVYVQPPVIIVWFWGPYYNPWRSPYYWGYYPPYYHPWHPYPPHRYRSNVHVHVNVNNTYNRTTVRRSKTSVKLQDKTRRNDYGTKGKPSTVNKGDSDKSTREKQSTGKESTGKPVQKDWKTDAEKNGEKGNVKNNKATVPSQKPSSKPSSKPQQQPAQKPSQKPSTQPTQKPASKPAARPAPKPAAAPAGRKKG